mgnify:CR=1 FL=1
MGATPSQVSWTILRENALQILMTLLGAILAGLAAVLGALVLRAVSQGKRITKQELIITLIVVALYGAGDEFHQRFTPGRSSEGIAVLFDVAGGALGVWVWQRWARRALRQGVTD